MQTTILMPVLALISWSLMMYLWMYATRLPAMKAAGLDPQDAAIPGSLSVLPASARQVADNYNHIHEQPTIFYALVFFTHLAGTADLLNIQLAWVYVILRVIHSLVQATINKVILRFAFFTLSSITLIILTVRNILFVL